MSILIKGMKMPSCCGGCRFCIGLSDTEWGTCAGCLIDDECREASSKSGCPLVEIPEPHGDLIDRDALLDFVRDVNTDYYSEVLGVTVEDIDEAPTVIEAERSENHDERTAD